MVFEKTALLDRRGILTTLAGVVVGASLLTAYVLNKVHAPPVSTSFNPINLSIGKAPDILSYSAYKAFPITITIDNAHPIAIPYEAIARADFIAERVNVICTTTLPNKPTHYKMNMKGVDFDQILGDVKIAGMGVGLNSYRFTSSDGQQLIVPFDNTELLLSSSMTNKTNLIDTPHDVIANHKDEVLYLTGLESVDAVSSGIFGFVMPDEKGKFMYKQLEALLVASDTKDSIPLSSFGSTTASVRATDGYSSVIPSESLNETLLVKAKNGSYNISTPNLGARSQVQDVYELGFIETNNR